MEEIFISINNFLSSAFGASATVAVVLEFVFRLFPTQKPISIAHVVADVVRSLAVVLAKFSELLDKVLPQKIKKEE